MNIFYTNILQIMKLYLRVDQLMINGMLDKSELGTYALAVSFGELPYFLAPILAGAIFPKLVRLDKHSQERSLLFVVAVIKWSLLISLLASVVYALGIWLLLPQIYSNDSELIFKPFVLINFGFCFFVLRAMISKLIILHQSYFLSLSSHVMAMLMNVSLNYYLIPEYGIVGAAAATLLSAIFGSLIVFYILPNSDSVTLYITALFRRLFVGWLSGWRLILEEIKK